jgi:YVTN family beta-propeller protein
MEGSEGHSSLVTLGVGAVVGGYRVESVLGSGSMGTVYSALDVALERRVALKVLTPELARDERFRERFLRESKLAASLEHPHIVPIHAAGEVDGVLFLAMRYVDGRDLSALLDSLGRLDPERAVHIVGQVAGALDGAHARGLVHRDVKPANILLAHHRSGDDYAYLCDFGLAKHASTVSSLTGSRAIVGTVDYLSPEQIAGGPVDGRVDVYALGCVLYQCITGEPPFRRENDLAALLAHANDPVPRPSERRAELPQAFDDVIARALAKDREARFPTCAALMEATQAVLRGEVPVLPPVAAGPTAAVRTFLFADVRGYTSFTREHGDEAAAALARRFASIVGELAPAHSGKLQELRGDEALVVFDSARAALRFALALQAKVAEDELPRSVGVGLDAGEAVPVEEGYRGGALNRAARLCSLAKPGEVLASDAVRELAGATEGVAYGFRRVERIKGFEKPVGVIEIRPAELPPRRELARRIKRSAAGSRPRIRLATIAVVVIIAAALIAALGLFGRDETAFDVDSIALLDAQTLEPVGSFDQPNPADILWADPRGGLWSFDIVGGSVARIDPESREVTARFPTTVSFGGVALGDGSLWLGDYDRAGVVRLDPSYGSVIARIDLPIAEEHQGDLTNDVTFGAGSVWVSYGKWPFRIARIDPRTNRVVKSFDLEGNEGQAYIKFGDGGLWVASQDTGRLWRIDPATNTVAATAKLHDGWVSDFLVVGGYAWAAMENDRGVWKIDSAGDVLKLVTTDGVPWWLSDDGTYLYATNSNRGTVSRIDTATDAVSNVQLGHRPDATALADGLVWAAVKESAEDARAGLDHDTTLHMVTLGDAFYATDPAMAWGGNLWQLQYAIGARLLRAPDIAQPRGTTLLPEVAKLPKVSNGGRTYTFRIRPGYRFSPPSNEPVTAAVMRYSIERALSPKITDLAATAPSLVSDIVGLQAYRAGKTAHISGIRLSGDKLAFTLANPAPDFPARVSLPQFSAVPLNIPARAHGVETPIPSAGPYYISSHIVQGQEVLKRNPNYSGPRPHQLDAIVVENAVGAEAGAERAASGDTDYAFAVDSPYPPSLALGGTLDRRFGAKSASAKAGHQRYFLPATSRVRAMEFNSESGIFRSAPLRRAVGYALDRPALAAANSGAPSADPIPPGIPGSGARIEYPLDGPDLARARALAGKAGRNAILFAPPADQCSDCAAEVAIVKRDLAKIGITVRVQTFDDPWREAAMTGARWDLVLSPWSVDYPDPSNFVNTLFDPGAISYAYAPDVAWPRYGDERFLARMRSANRVAGHMRGAAYRSLVADMMRESPPSMVFAYVRFPPQVFSERVGCQVFRPQDWGWVDLAALCLK